ncbi:MAG TPA: ABC transporter permease [Acidobacteriaceae bacterium]|nr:ABC transporter permease [Acidobacteriaceae bacterium]
MSGAWRDVRLALRQMRKAPGFYLTAILTLALGMGATIAIFSLVEGILLRPLPFADPARLVIVGDHLGNNPNPGVTAREIATYERATTAFSSMGGFAGAGYEISGAATAQLIAGARLGAGVFSALGVSPELGRVFTKQEDDGHTPVAVISDALWLNRYHRDPHVIGQAIVLDRKSYSIVGVMPPSFEFPLSAGRMNKAQVWVPLSLTAEELSDKNVGAWMYRMVARVKDGVTLQQAAEDAHRVSQQIMRDFPPTMAAIRIRGDALSLREQSVAATRPVLRALFVAVLIVLAIACANVAGLLLVRAIGRRREYAVQAALGAPPRAILRQSIVAGLILGLAGGALAVGLSAVAVRTVLRLLPDSLPRVDTIAIDPAVLIFALLLALLTGALCSAAPAFAATRASVIDNLKEAGRSGTGSLSHSWLRSFLVVAEIATALVLLTTAGSFLRSYQKMLAVNPGFQPEHVLAASYQLPLEQYSTQTQVENFTHAVIDRLVAKPGVVAAGFTNSLPTSNNGGLAAYTVEGQPAATWKLTFAAFVITGGDYFRTMGIPLLAGRYFTPQDRADAPLVIIVNEAMAKHCWPGQSALGKAIHVGNPQKGYPWATVVGVVGNTVLGPRDAPVADQWYMPAEQPSILYGSAAKQNLVQAAGGFIALRSSLDPDQMKQVLRSSVAEVDPQLALDQVETMRDSMANVEAPRRFNTDLMTSFAAAALLLALTGIYAVVAFSVTLRSREIAIRMAMGAQRASIARMVLLSGAKLAFAGCTLGVLGSLAVSHLLVAFLFGVSATDPLIYTVTIATMFLISILAAALPANRAAGTDPVEALRAV